MKMGEMNKKLLFKLIKAFLSISTKDKNPNPIIETRYEKLIPYKFNTFTIVDWNKTSDKLLIKFYSKYRYLFFQIAVVRFQFGAAGFKAFPERRVELGSHSLDNN